MNTDTDFWDGPEICRERQAVFIVKNHLRSSASICGKPF
jgi:hypothetical protein